jgi:endoglucanase
VVDKQLIKTLVESWGPSGYEHQVRAIIADLVKDLADEIRTDPSGNLICRMGSGGAKVMIAAHMDEIGLIISHIDRDGFARFAPIGGLFTPTLHGNRVRFENGVIGNIATEGGFIPALDRGLKLNEFFVDFSGALEAAQQIGVGSPAGMWRTLDERGSRLIAKSMDDRIGCVVAIETMRALHGKTLPNELYFVFTTQEEVGVRGARTSAFGVGPDYGIALDVTSAADTPKASPMAVKLGGGAAIKVVDGGHIVPPAFKALLIRRAEENNIPYQLEILQGGTTDAAAIQTARGGVPSAAISIPTRYIHTTSETVDANDVQACIDLLAATLAGSFEGV